MATVIPANIPNISKAAAVIRKNLVVVFPTETVYGLGANALNSSAISTIFRLKKRPLNNPLILHFSSLQDVNNYFYLSKNEELLARTFWPGPLTLIVSHPKAAAKDISPLCQGDVTTFAVRIPQNPYALALISESKVPIAAPSANLANNLSPTTARQVYETFIDQDLLIIDGGKTVCGLESTIVEVLGNNINILRFGHITPEIIYDKIKIHCTNHIDASFKSPGLFKKHYSPNTPLRLNALEINEGEALLGFGDISIIPNLYLKRAKKILNLSQVGDLVEAASNLFQMLWLLDKENYKSIAVMPIPNVGVGRAINERLFKAAAN